ncbi:MAG: endolytic transglycosylase MltG [Minisyncoccia bacterium]
MDFNRYAQAASSALKSLLANSRRAWILAFVLAFVIVIGYRAAFSPPADFPERTIVSVSHGASAPEVAAELAGAHVIKHPGLLRLILRVTGTAIHVQEGPYLFDTPEDLFVVAFRLAVGDYGLPPVRLTFPEGETVRDLATRVSEAFSTISESDFLKAAQPYEGYLFPDTYFLLPSANTTSIIQTMRMNFNTKIAPLMNDVQASGHSLSDIITLASLVEREARSPENKRIVAGILWNRLALGMALQVDAVFGYIYGRDTYSPSFADLKVDSPYNTYTHKGLPPGPIANPGIESIDAAIHPTETKYLYYLTGKDNLMHYATTYAGHLANQRKYLP